MEPPTLRSVGLGAWRQELRKWPTSSAQRNPEVSLSLLALGIRAGSLLPSSTLDPSALRTKVCRGPQHVRVPRVSSLQPLCLEGPAPSSRMLVPKGEMPSQRHPPLRVP